MMPLVNSRPYFGVISRDNIIQTFIGIGFGAESPRCIAEYERHEYGYYQPYHQ